MKALRDLVIVTDCVIDPVGLLDRVNGKVVGIEVRDIVCVTDLVLGKLVGIGLCDIVLEVVSEGGLLA